MRSYLLVCIVFVASSEEAFFILTLDMYTLYFVAHCSSLFYAHKPSAT